MTSLFLLATLFLMQARSPSAFLATWARCWLTCRQASINTPTPTSSAQERFQPLCPKPVALPGLLVAKVQDPAFGLAEPHPIGFSPAIQPVHIPP